MPLVRYACFFGIDIGKTVFHLFGLNVRDEYGAAGRITPELAARVRQTALPAGGRKLTYFCRNDRTSLKSSNLCFSNCMK
jgi:hypothetical protein